MRQEAAAKPEQVRKGEAVRRTLGAGTTTIAMADDYGYPLQYHGWVHTITWPGPQDMAFLRNAGAIDGEFSSERYLRKLIAETGCATFTTTDLARLDRDLDLKRVLESEARELPSEPGVRVFDLRPMLDATRASTP